MKDVQTIRLEEITVDRAMLPRDSEDNGVIDDYALEFRKYGVDALPPIDLFNTSGKLLLADGLYRVQAAERAGLETIKARIHYGSKDEAAYFASGANRRHGVRLTNAEKRRAARNVIENPAVRGTRSHAAIAEHVGVSLSLVKRLDAEWEAGRLRLAAQAEADEKALVARQQIREIEGIASARPIGKTLRGKLDAAREVVQVTRRTRSGKTVSYKLPTRNIGSKTRTKAEQAAEKDALGKPVPDFARAAFVGAFEWRKAQTAVSAAVDAVNRAAELAPDAGRDVDRQGIGHIFEDVRNNIADGLPHAVCPDCATAGELREDCGCCGGRGWLSRKQHAARAAGGNGRASAATACPNCGGREFDQDGDCAKCFEPCGAEGK